MKEIRRYRQFILICDGYDECNRWTNLLAKDHFNKPRQWQVKTIICCRTQYLGPNYRNCYTLPSRLTASGTQIVQANGLTEVQRSLLIQRGATNGSTGSDTEP